MDDNLYAQVASIVQRERPQRPSPSKKQVEDMISAAVTTLQSSGVQDVTYSQIYDSGSISADVTWATVTLPAGTPPCKGAFIQANAIAGDGEDMIVEVRRDAGDTARPLIRHRFFEANGGDSETTSMGMVGITGQTFQINITRGGSVQVTVGLLGIY